MSALRDAYNALKKFGSLDYSGIMKENNERCERYYTPCNIEIPENVKKIILAGGHAVLLENLEILGQNKDGTLHGIATIRDTFYPKPQPRPTQLLK